MPSIEFERGSSVEAALIAAFFSAAAGLDTTKEDYWYKYNKMRLKELVDASKGQLKRDYSAEKIGGTKGRPYKPVRIPKKRITTKANTQVKNDSETPKTKVIKLSKKEDLTGYKMDFASKQDKHYQGTKQYKDSVNAGKYPSYFTVSREELKEIILKYAQTGINQYDKNQDWQNCETILDCDKVIGYAVNRDTGAKIETKYFRVHYSKDKVIVVI